ncbi:hypothetical protein FQA47_011135 [Oryzias melastigma]|uniref:Uncharacterized protein n=1 Tax=Oryzias melastigma TaxID=30732 RepID=A0A834FJ98_ORYME|nr:hypothetical protein FQA47_011135 [Oryzias melastigma]
MPEEGRAREGMKSDSLLDLLKCPLLSACLEPNSIRGGTLTTHSDSLALNALPAASWIWYVLSRAQVKSQRSLRRVGQQEIPALNPADAEASARPRLSLPLRDVNTRDGVGHPTSHPHMMPLRSAVSGTSGVNYLQTEVGRTARHDGLLKAATHRLRAWSDIHSDVGVFLCAARQDMCSHTCFHLQTTALLLPAVSEILLGCTTNIIAGIIGFKSARSY